MYGSLSSTWAGEDRLMGVADERHTNESLTVSWNVVQRPVINRAGTALHLRAHGSITEGSGACVTCSMDR